MLQWRVILAHQSRPHPKTALPKHGYAKIGPAKNAQILPLCFDNDTNCSPRNSRVLTTIQIPLPYTSSRCKSPLRKDLFPGAISPLTRTFEMYLGNA